VASTFSAKPYIFNKENLARYSGERYCRGCRCACPFDASYEQLQAQLFSAPAPATATRYDSHPLEPVRLPDSGVSAVLFHDEMLSPAHALLETSGLKLFVFDPRLHGGWSRKRLQFVADCLVELEEVEVWQGELADVLRHRGVAEVVTQRTPNPDLQALLRDQRVIWHAEPAFAPVSLGENALKRFSRYWEKVGPVLLGDRHYRKP
jgi:deoxyribodipyrimidine photo-lyase